MTIKLILRGMKASVLINYMVILTIIAIFYQCSEPHKRFEDPPWLGGTNIETLEKSGNYTHFIALMDKADYRTSIENQMFTLFVANDTAFEEFFEKAGINSIEELNRREAEELFGLHILINPRSRDQLMYEYSMGWGELETPEGEYGTLFHRKQTYSIPKDYTETVKYNQEFKDQTLILYRENTFIPLFTKEYFEDYFGDPAGSDYLYMYPDSYWSGTQWHDAMVKGEGARTSSGFIYYLDRVVAPLPTIDKYLKDNPQDFSLFFDLAQRFATYEAANDLNEQNERVYRKSYSQISNIADERGPNTDLPRGMLNLYSTFIPYDNVLQDFLDNTIYQYYESLDSVPELFLVYLLQSHLNNFLNVPSKMEQQFKNYYGDDIEIDPNEDIDDAKMCSNGIIYAMNYVMEPNAFTCVPGPIFYNKNYTTFLYALNNSGLLTSVTQPDIDVCLFAPTNEELNEYGIRENRDGTDVIIEILSSDGNWQTMEDLDMEQFVSDYIYFGLHTDFSTESYLRMASDNYLHIKDGKITSGGNQVANDHNTITQTIESDKNGFLYYVDNTLKKPQNTGENIFTDPDLSAFSDLLTKAELIDSTQVDYEKPGILYPRVIFINDLKQWTILAPTNQAIADAELENLIPEEKNELRDFIYYHFVRNQCIFDDGIFSGRVPTHRIDTVIGSEITYSSLDFNNAAFNLSVTDLSGQTINISHNDANDLVKNGVLHKVNTVLFPK